MKKAICVFTLTVCLFVAFATTRSQAQANGVEKQSGPTPEQKVVIQQYSKLLHKSLKGPENTRQKAINDLLDWLLLEYLHPAAMRDSRNTCARQMENSRMDEQLGSGPGSGGSSALVATAGTTSTMGGGVETGALTQGINGNTVTLGGNADAIWRFLSGLDVFTHCPAGATSCATPILKDFNFTVSVDMNQGSTKTLPTSNASANPIGTPAALDLLTGKNRFSGASVKYVFMNPHDVRSKSFQRAWLDVLKPPKAQTGSVSTLDDHGAVKTLLEEKKAQLTNALLTGKENTEAAIKSKLEDFLAKMNPEDIQPSPAVPAWTSLDIKGMVDTLNRQPVFSAEYVYQRPVDQPDTHRVRLLATMSPMGPNSTISFNAAATAYGSASASRQFGRWRDAQASLQLERQLTRDAATSPMRFSLAGYFQYMVSPGLIQIDPGNLVPGTTIDLGRSAAVALAPPGPMWIGEAKVTFKLKDSGLEIPFAITRASRTDLINSTVTRGHFGLTFDLDKLFAGKPKQ